MDSTFFLAAPPSFESFRPHDGVEIYQRKLPHWRQEGCTYFVTFRTADSLPVVALRALDAKRWEWEQANPPPHNRQQLQEYRRLHSILEEQWLDAGHGVCPFKQPLIRNELRSGLVHAAEAQAEVFGYVCMPNHVHALIKPREGFRLEDALKRIKGRSAVHANRLLGRKGQLWFDESYDRIVRDREHLWKCLQYIGRNPSKARLRPGTSSRWVRPDWEEVGWAFKAPLARRGTPE